MTISDEAVEAAVKAFYGPAYSDVADAGLEYATDQVRAMLEAAAPHIAAEALRPVLDLHNADGTRWVGFPRADKQEAYCTECNKEAPCPTITALTNPYRSQA